MREVNRRVKKRREERIRALQHEGHSPWPPVPSRYSGDMEGRVLGRPERFDSIAKPVARRQPKLLVQTVAAVLLFLFTYLAFQLHTPLATQTQALIAKIMTRDYNFSGIAAWYEDKIGGVPAFIPTFSKNTNPHSQNSVEPNRWFFPVKGDVTRSFDKAHPFVEISVSPAAPVVASAEGLIAFVGEKEGWGKCVVVRHAGGYETWYGPFRTIRVKEADWVQPEQLLGELDDKVDALRFGVKKGDHFVDPLDVMKVE